MGIFQSLSHYLLKDCNTCLNDESAPTDLCLNDCCYHSECFCPEQHRVSYDLLHSKRRSRSTDCLISLNHNPSRRRRSFSEGYEDDFGWYEELGSPDAYMPHFSSIKKALSIPKPASETPQYVLEESLPSQKLWYETAGQRPKQPEIDREYFERIWLNNFENSSIAHLKNYIDSSNNDCNHERANSDDDGETVYKGDGPYSNAVSRSFIDDNFAMITLQIPRFKISKNICGSYASFLVVINIGGVKFGVWKRYSNFKALAETVNLNFANLKKLILIDIYSTES